MNGAVFVGQKHDQFCRVCSLNPFERQLWRRGGKAIGEAASPVDYFVKIFQVLRTSVREWVDDQHMLLAFAKTREYRRENLTALAHTMSFINRLNRSKQEKGHLVLSEHSSLL